ncbi:MAG: hypothetical protein ACREHD_13260 [Pirellulales bacterium]
MIIRSATSSFHARGFSPNLKSLKRFTTTAELAPTRERRYANLATISRVSCRLVRPTVMEKYRAFSAANAEPEPDSERGQAAASPRSASDWHNLPMVLAGRGLKHGQPVAFDAE